MGSIRPDKWDALRKRMAEIGLEESDLVETFVRGSGPGGQKVNKSSIAVQLKHQPSGLEVKVQRERSRDANRFLARRVYATFTVKKYWGRGPSNQRKRLRRKSKSLVGSDEVARGKDRRRRISRASTRELARGSLYRRI